jgi:hypothetical protein
MGEQNDDPGRNLQRQILDICVAAKGFEDELVSALGGALLTVLIESAPSEREAADRVEKFTEWMREYAKTVLSARH